MKMMRRLIYLLPITLLFFTACNDQTESKKRGTEATTEDSGEAFKPVAAVTDDGGSQVLVYSLALRRAMRIDNPRAG
jgi:hypothetical protein